MLLVVDDIQILNNQSYGENTYQNSNNKEQLLNLIGFSGQINN